MLAEDIIAKLQIIPVERLRSHEETIEYNFQKLREAMLNLGRLVDPLIVDNKHYIVIDGNHRRRVLETIKCPNAACQLVDYHSSEIRVGTWYPVSKTLHPQSMEGIKTEPVDFEEGMAAIQKMEATFMFVKKKNGHNECFLFNSNEKSIQGIISQQRKFITSLEGRDLQYIADDKSSEYLDAGYGVFFRRAYTKDEIITEALAGRQMPPKSTRHIIPDRIIRLNLHLGWLSESPDVAKQLMDESLKRRLNEGSIRRYVEPVIVLY